MCMPSQTIFVQTLIVLDRASDDLENSDKLRSLLKDLREARQAKCRAGLSQIDHSELSVRLFYLESLTGSLTMPYSYQIFVP